MINRQPCYTLAWLFAFVSVSVSISAQNKTPKPQPPITEVKGKLVYTTDESGNRIPDFSYCGYMSSNVAIPNVQIKMVVPHVKGDATARIQWAINYVSALPLDANGFRGVVLLQKGTYEIGGQLRIDSSGVILRGSGMDEKGTVLYGAGTDRETLIRISGTNNRTTGNKVPVADIYVPVNSMKLNLAEHTFKSGDNILVHRPSTSKWIMELSTQTFGGGLSSLGWKPGDRDIFWDRKITAVEGNTITLDAPITTALDTSYGGGNVSSYQWTGRISNVGIENLLCVSAYDKSNPKDEAHRWMAITMENVKDAWVRQATFKHFAGSAVYISESAKNITVEDCKSLSPVSEIGGQRRYSFFTAGQQTLIQRCYAQYGYHDFAVGFCAPGPNAFVQCQSVMPHSFSGTIDSWSSGVLFDIVNVDGNALRFANRGQDGQGAGWTGANSVFWQCTAAVVENQKPPTANNWAFGTWAQFQGNGYWGESNNAIQPRSLYYAQLGERLGLDVSKRAQILFVETNASSSPTVEVAQKLTANSILPATTLSEWIDASNKREPIPVNSNGVQTALNISKVNSSVKSAARLKIENGWLVYGDKVITGKRQDVQWWNGSVSPTDLPKMKPHLTRFVPGRTGTGLTDDLEEVADKMKSSNTVVMEHNYGLWYDRRRDDHERIRRMDGEVWPPFYELPFARSGESSGYDGLSKYDLKKYNPWYWNRLKKFADLADENGLVLVHQNYFQHNIIEAGAHYADFPWRPANNINNTGFPEPVPYAGDKRVFMAEQFYDVKHPVRRPLHVAYIRKCLDNFKENNSVIQLISAEYTGPTHFVSFWLDVIRDWEKETGKKQIIGLSTTKDVQDSILADRARAEVVDLIDIRYWHYQANGTAYAPKGGQNLAPRQHARLLNPKKTSFEQVYRAVSEYKQKFPAKAVTYSGDSYDQFGWAVFIAGGSLAVLPKISVDGFLASASTMSPVINNEKNSFVLKNKTGETITYVTNDVRPDFKPLNKNYVVRIFNSRTGELDSEQKVDAGKSYDIKEVREGMIIWISEK